MVRSKLTEQDQQAIVSQYRTSDVTTGALADSFGVSASTITRILKDGIPADDYRNLVRSRRGGTTRSSASLEQAGFVSESDDTDDTADASQADSAMAQLSLMDEAAEDDNFYAIESATEEAQTETEVDGSSVGDPDQDEFEDDMDGDDDGDDEDFEEEDDDSLQDPEVQDLQSDLEDSSELAVPENDDFDPQRDESEEDDEDLDLDDDDDLEEDDFDPDPTPALQVLPLEDLDYPPVCFAVIDRHQELTTRPLEDFTALDISALSSSGIPEEVLRKAKTLPIFDSHRVARRFSDMCKRDGNAPHRIIQFQGQTLVVASEQLKRKGITHLLVDGQIFSI